MQRQLRQLTANANCLAFSLTLRDNTSPVLFVNDPHKSTPHITQSTTPI